MSRWTGMPVSLTDSGERAAPPPYPFTREAYNRHPHFTSAVAYCECPEAFWPASDFPTKGAVERARAIGRVIESRYTARAAMLELERRAIVMLERMPDYLPSFERQYAILRWRHPGVNPDTLRRCIALALTESPRWLVEATGDRSYEDYRAAWRGWKPRQWPPKRPVPLRAWPRLEYAVTEVSHG